MTASPPRRVVTGLDSAGRSAIAIDDGAPAVVWTSTASPADNADPADQGGGSFTFDIPVGGTSFFCHDFPPRSEFPLHSSDTLDLGVIVSGEVVLVTETGETVLRAGDLIVDRGVTHAWRNDTDQPCRLAMVMVAAHPVGAGAKLPG